jgi:DNA-binding response OmpR family regulator
VEAWNAAETPSAEAAENGPSGGCAASYRIGRSAVRETILLVDDEPPLLEALRFSLEDEGFRVRTAATGSEAVSAATGSPPDLVILDVMLPDFDGLEVTRQLRARAFRGPIVLLTARDRELDQVVGLEVGADDYVTKPFSTAQLIARVRAHLRRERRSAASDDPPVPLRFGVLTLDVGRREIWVGERPADLTPREFDLLLELARHPRRTLTRDVLLERVWGYDFEGTSHVVTATIQRLREKVEEDPRHPRFIVAVRGIGYRFEAD